VAEELDFVARYAMGEGLIIRNRTVLVEGTTDAELFQLAARLEYEATGTDLLGRDLAIVAAGVGHHGGTRNLCRRLWVLRDLARNCLSENGSLRYRFIGLFDNDDAGKQAVKAVRAFDASILEYRDVFRLWPVMPLPNSLDPGTVEKAFHHANACYKRLKWELEDLLPQEFVEVFLSEHPGAVTHSTSIGNRLHRDLTRDGKARLHRFVKQCAVRDDLSGVIEVLRAVRFYLRMK